MSCRLIVLSKQREVGEQKQVNVFMIHVESSSMDVVSWEGEMKRKELIDLYDFFPFLLNKVFKYFTDSIVLHYFLLNLDSKYNEENM